MKFLQIMMQQAVLAIIVMFTPVVYAMDTYKLDESHSYVNWQISHFGFSSPSGKWLATGTLELDKDKPQDSKVNVTINVADMITGLPELDKHLKSEDFFDTAKYPTATFVSNKVTLTGKDTAKVLGMLTVHGVTKPVTLNVRLNKAGMSPISNKMTAGFSATAVIKRSDFGISAYLPGLGDEVKLTIETEAVKSA
jgi:polyisoprenoid-binding protein YceI